MSENLYTPNCIRTFSGKYIDVANIKPADIFPIDIAVALARICRFGSFTKKPYSVAEHSVWCMNKAIELYPDDKQLAFRCLMHDAHEAYLGDWPTPLLDSIDKSYPGVKNALNVMKRIVQANINTRFGIIQNPLDCEKVKHIDKLALEFEWERKKLNWRGLPLTSDASYEVFLEYFKKLVTVPISIHP